jgi:hypothetical protein
MRTGGLPRYLIFCGLRFYAERGLRFRSFSTGSREQVTIISAAFPPFWQVQTCLNVFWGVALVISILLQFNSGLSYLNDGKSMTHCQIITLADFAQLINMLCNREQILTIFRT